MVPLAMPRTGTPQLARLHARRRLFSSLISHPCAGAEVRVREAENKALRFSPPYGGRVWDSGFVLSGWLQEDRLRGKRVVELGAGAGLVGLCCAHMGAEVTLTDGAESLLELAAERAWRRKARPRRGLGEKTTTLSMTPVNDSCQ